MVVAAAPGATTTTLDANRLAHQASFGPSEALVADMARMGPKAWITAQMGLRASTYTSGGGDGPDRHTNKSNGFCEGQPGCWEENLSVQPLLRDFYRNALTQPDQLRQRVAFALQQILVISGESVTGTYGFRNYHNMLLEHAFGNYRDLLRKVTLSPLMGDFLNHVNNDKDAPNENYARELMQLFSIGLCKLNGDGSLAGGYCQPTFDGRTVREVAYALTGWTYPQGGQAPWGCPKGFNCRYLNGDMMPAPAFHDTAERQLLSGVSVPAGSTAESALEKVLDSLMQHPNMAPFIGRQLIQHLVLSNPSPGYVSRVAQAFQAGRHDGIGTGARGDLAATVAAVLLDPEARRSTVGAKDGMLRQPVLLLTGVMRAFGGQTSGRPFGYWWGSALSQMVFSAPSVFNFFTPDYRVPGAAMDLIGPAFGIHNASAAVARMQFLNCTLYWKGGCSTDLVTELQPFLTQYTNDGARDRGLVVRSPADEKLIDRLSLLAYGQVLPADERQLIADAMDLPWSDRETRLRMAAWLIFASPRYQIIH